MNAKSLRRVALGAGLVLSAVGSAVAHHSFAMFDCSKTVTTNGSVRMFHWPVPHVYIQLYIPNAEGGQATWAVEVGDGPNMLLRYGWTRTSLMWGDKMSIIGYPLQHGRPGLYFLSVTLPSGEVLRMGPKHEQPQG